MPSYDGDAKEQLVVEEQEESTPDKKPHIKTSIESLRCCLFCNKEHPGLKGCIDHMRVKHSFHLLDADCLIDLKGLLAYIATRIQVGQLCLHCSKQFNSAQACQHHMLEKGHCAMNMEDEDEYLDFYDFTKTYENHPLVIKKDDEEIKEQPEGEEDDGEESWEELDDADMQSADEEKPSTEPSF